MHVSIRPSPASSPPSTSYYQSSPSPRVPTSFVKSTNTNRLPSCIPWLAPFVLVPVVHILDAAHGIRRSGGELGGEGRRPGRYPLCGALSASWSLWPSFPDFEVVMMVVLLRLCTSFTDSRGSLMPVAMKSTHWNFPKRPGFAMKFAPNETTDALVSIAICKVSLIFRGRPVRQADLPATLRTPGIQHIWHTMVFNHKPIPASPTFDLSRKQSQYIHTGPHLYGDRRCGFSLTFPVI